MKIQLLLTGNELMSGHTVDSNSAMIADHLATRGFSIQRKVTLGDDPQLLLAEMQSQSKNADVLIINGGLGPTSDDLTAQIVSDLCDQPLTENSIAMQHLESWCQQRNIGLNQANLKQAILPLGVTIIPNPTGSAVGFSIEYNNCLIMCTPGVPSELKGMLEQTMVDSIAAKFPNTHAKKTLRVQTFGLGESTIQQMILDDYTDWPEQVELSFRAGIPQLEIKLSISQPQHQTILRDCYQRFQLMISDYIVGEESTTLAEAVIQLLVQRQRQITTAESCTGGLIAAAITGIAGASQAFEAGYVTYSNTIKQQLLEVPGTILQQHGAVSEPVVKAMAAGAIAKSKADYAIAVSGVAGPDGGSDDKPVGTVWIAWGHKGRIKTLRLQFNYHRALFQQLVTATTLDLIRRDLLGIDTEPYYVTLRKYTAADQTPSH